MHVHTQVDRTTIHHAGQLIRSMVALSSHPEEINFHLYSLNNKDWSVVDQLKNENITNNITTFDVTKAKSRSYGHGQAINLTLSLFDTNTINIVCDSDVLIVMPKWDEFIRHLVKSGVGTFGTPYENIGGYTSGTGNEQTYKGLPNAIFMLFAPTYPWSDLDMLPDKQSKVALTKDDAEINGLVTGQVLLKDVGWRIPTFLYENSIPYLTLKHIKSSQKESIVLNGIECDYHEEYHVDSIPFCVHHRGASKHPLRRSKMSNNFYDQVWDFISSKNDKHQWEKISNQKKIITIDQPKIKHSDLLVSKTMINTSTKFENFVILVPMLQSGEVYTSKHLKRNGLDCGVDEIYNLSLINDPKQAKVGEISWAACHLIDLIPQTTAIYLQVQNPIETISMFVAYDNVKNTVTNSNIFNTQESKNWIINHAPGFDFLISNKFERATLAWISWYEKIIKSERIIMQFNVENIESGVINTISDSVNVPIGNKIAAKFIPSQHKNKVLLNESHVTLATWEKLVATAKRCNYVL